MDTPIRWGIVGTGVIAGQLARALAEVDDAELVAVGSRTAERARAFGDEHGVARRHGSYEALFGDPDCDVVYVATPHALHRPNTLAALAAGKAVLCEKPFALNAAEAREMVAVARERGLFLMEAMWTRYLPAIVELRRLIASGEVGDPRLFTASFGFRTEEDDRGILYDPALGGGALLDVGVYPVSFAHMLWGPPARVVGDAHLGDTGIDEQSAGVMTWDDGAMAVVSASFQATTRPDAELACSAGRIRIEPPWWRPDTLTVTTPDEREETVHRPFLGNGYVHEVLEVHRCLRAGLLESATMPLDESIAIMESLDRLRAAFGLVYPGEI